MSDAVKELEAQLEQIKKGLFLMGPERYRALSTHETDDLIVELQKVTESALSQVQTLK
ncbi:MAG: hypothetical protein ACX931_11450 [Saccharospirillum sp.]